MIVLVDRAVKGSDDVIMKHGRQQEFFSGGQLVFQEGGRENCLKTLPLRYLRLFCSYPSSIKDKRIQFEK
jgi:hypothetical protein